MLSIRSMSLVVVFPFLVVCFDRQLEDSGVGNELKVSSKGKRREFEICFFVTFFWFHYYGCLDRIRSMNESGVQIGLLGRFWCLMIACLDKRGIFSGLR